MWGTENIIPMNRFPLLFLLTLLTWSCGDKPTSPGLTGRIVLQVSYGESAAKPLESQVQLVSRMVARLFHDDKAILVQDLQQEGDRWKGELEATAGSYRVELEAYRGSKVKWRGEDLVVVQGGKASRANITLQNINRVPVADAGPDQTVDVGTRVKLDGGGSEDADGDNLTYSWTAPAGINLSNEVQAREIFFTPTTPGEYRFILQVHDGLSKSPPSIVEVTVIQPNRAPIADAGPTQMVDVGDSVQLDGRGSSDFSIRFVSSRWLLPVRPLKLWVFARVVRSR